jgi:predicted RNase H-like HicB family nuclease
MARGRTKKRIRKDSYTVVIERDPDTGWLVGEVVELPGCYTQAADLPSLERNIREAIRAYRKATRSVDPASEFVGTWQVSA